jgi:DNA-binding transcriptional ArsR family regulator
MSESAISHQLRLLRTMRLVRVRREGRLAYYAVDDHHILELLRQVRTHVQEGA